MRHLKHITEYINEARKIPTGDNWLYLDTNHSIRINDTNKYKILTFIYTRGSNGAKYSDILKYIVEEIWHYKYDWRIYRGKYSSSLQGTHRDGGILPTFCEKNENNRYVLVKPALLLDHFNNKMVNDTLITQYDKLITKADAIKRIIPETAEIKTMLRIRDGDGDILSKLEGALDGSEDSVGLVKLAKAIAVVFGYTSSQSRWLKMELQNKFNASEIDIILNYFHKNTFELEGLDSLFGHSDADW